MRKTGLLFLLCFIITVLYGQNNQDENSVKSILKADISLQGIGASYDAKLGKSTILELASGLGGGYNIYEGGVDYQLAFLQPALYFYVAPKFFYNRNKRLQKGKRTDLNAGNYVGFRVKYTTSDIASSGILRDAFLINAHWGLQRPLSQHWSFYTQVGGGYGWDVASGFGTIYPAIDLKFSYVFTQRKKYK